MTNVPNSMPEDSFAMYDAGCQKCNVINVGSVSQKTVPCYEYMLRYNTRMSHVLNVMYACAAEAIFCCPTENIHHFKS